MRACLRVTIPSGVACASAPFRRVCALASRAYPARVCRANPPEHLPRVVRWSTGESPLPLVRIAGSAHPTAPSNRRKMSNERSKHARIYRRSFAVQDHD